MESTGDIPRHSVFNADVLFKDLIYIFGGQESLAYKTNETFSLCPTSGVFCRLPVIGARPSPRCRLQGWCHHCEAKLFFFAGVAEAEAGSLVAGDTIRDKDNLLCCLDLATNTWSKPETNGNGPSPREAYAVATVGNHVVIHGGQGMGLLNDTHMLDMETMTWTSLTMGGPRVYGHSLSPFAVKHFLLAGGDGASKEVWILDLRDLTWKKREESLSDSLYCHRAVVTKSMKGLSIVCLGGPSHVKNMVVFEVE